MRRHFHNVLFLSEAKGMDINMEEKTDKIRNNDENMENIKNILSGY